MSYKRQGGWLPSQGEGFPSCKAPLTSLLRSKFKLSVDTHNVLHLVCLANWGGSAYELSLGRIKN